MATQSLDKNKIDAGIRLIEELDKNSALDIVSAMWYYYTDLERWELLIYPPKFNKKITEQQEFYRIINKCLKENSDISLYIELSDVRLIYNIQQINMLKAIKETLQTDKVYCARIGGSIFKGGIYIDDALLYRNSI